MPDNNMDSLGPWKNDDLAATARVGAGVGSDEDLPDEVRFLRNVANLIRLRTAQPSAGADPAAPAIFLARPNPVGLKLPNPPKRVPMLNNGLTPLAGRLWMVGAGPASGHYSDYDFTDEDDLFQLVVDVLGEGDRPTMLFDPRPAKPEIRYYPRGLARPDEYRSVSTSTDDIDLDKVLEVINAVYMASLVTPDAQSGRVKIWHDHSKWWPKQHAEGLIQDLLKAGLAGAFLTCTIRDEQPMADGRLDLEIEECDPLEPGVITRHAVLELKVLRSFGESGNVYSTQYTEDWVKSGVQQAAAYRNNKGTKLAALLCFDMRKDQTGQACFSHVLDLAKTLAVSLHCWHLYASSKVFREASVRSAGGAA